MKTCSFLATSEVTTHVRLVLHNPVLNSELRIQFVIDTKIFSPTMSPSPMKMTEEKVITTQDLMNFMIKFKDKVDNNMATVKYTNKKLDDRLKELDEGMRNLNTEVKNIDIKNNDVHERMEMMLSHIEEEMQSSKYIQMRTLQLRVKEKEISQKEFKIQDTRCIFRASEATNCQETMKLTTSHQKLSQQIPPIISLHEPLKWKNSSQRLPT